MRMSRLIFAAAMVLAPAAAWAQQGEPVLKRVMLSSGGVGYVEYAARVTGEALLRLLQASPPAS